MAAMICSKDELSAFFQWSSYLLLFAIAWNVLDIIDSTLRTQSWYKFASWLVVDLVQYVTFASASSHLDSAVGLSFSAASLPWWAILIVSFGCLIADVWTVLKNLERFTPS
jgi:hypothetical protein